jgi:hypothetical protein
MPEKNNMTMPHLQNCPHSDSGWCLSCVGKSHELYERKLAIERKKVAELEDAIAELEEANEELSEYINDFRRQI